MPADATGDEIGAPARPRLTIREHKPDRLAAGCVCGLQPAHADECEPREREP